MSGWWLVSYLVLWGLLALTVVLLLIVLRQLGLIYVRTKQGGLQLDEGPEIGQMIAPFGALDAQTGEEFLFPDGAARLNLLLFASPTCSLCKDALAGLGSLPGTKRSRRRPELR